MSTPDWLSRAKSDVEQFTGVRPQPTVLHLMENGQRVTPVLTTPEGRVNYISRYLLGEYNPETNNALFPGLGTAKEGAKVLALMGYGSIDVTELLLQKRGITLEMLSLINPQALLDLQNESVSVDELKSLLTQKK